MKIEIAGQRILEVRNLTRAEKEREGWDDYGTVIALVLENGTVLYPSRDGEGNGGGALFGTAPDGRAFTV